MRSGWARNELESALMKNRLNANRSDLVFCNSILVCDSCLFVWFDSSFENSIERTLGELVGKYCFVGQAQNKR